MLEGIAILILLQLAGELIASFTRLPIPGPVIGLGLLEQVPVEDILARADPEDRDGDGISGKPNMVLDAVSGQRALGRFGWRGCRQALGGCAGRLSRGRLRGKHIGQCPPEAGPASDSAHPRRRHARACRSVFAVEHRALAGA